MWRSVIIFLILNFAALGIGSYLMGEGPRADWYQGLQKAPWTPAGWVFGAAWTLIMICFSFYMAKAVQLPNRNELILLFAIQWILNVSWNPAFFYFHNVFTGLIIISLLTILVTYLLFTNLNNLGKWTWLIVPYFTWLLIATSLNAYIYFKNQAGIF